MVLVQHVVAFSVAENYSTTYSWLCVFAAIAWLRACVCVSATAFDMIVLLLRNSMKLMTMLDFQL